MTEKRSWQLSLTQPGLQVSIISEQRLHFYVSSNSSKRIDQNRKFRAATRICSLGRGKLARLEAAELRAQHWAALVFQKWTRGAFGRKRAREARWKKLRVVPSLYALKLMRLRSR